MVIVFPSIVATAVFELVYVNAPALLLVVGGVMVKGESPIFFKGKEKLVKTVTDTVGALKPRQLLKTVLPRPVQLIPSMEVAMVFALIISPTHPEN
jgi:hypothetical protein